MCDDKENLIESKKKWTSVERLELAAQLDAQLDNYIDGLEKRGSENVWSEERLEHELKTHPFFIKESPKPGEDIHPMYEGLQKLKYDPEENTAEELALNYKQDGNFYMKHKKFRIAIYSFTEGLKAGCTNPEMLAVLYNNRSAAHYFLRNYRSALADAEKALKLKPDYPKARWRAAQCAYYLEKYDLCTHYCELTLNEQPENEQVETLLKKNKTRKLEHERNLRREQAETKKRQARLKTLRDVLKQRAVRFAELRNAADKITDELIIPKFLPLEEHPVHFDEDGETLVWPVAFSYPEFLVSDYHQNVRDSDTIEDCLRTLFAEPLPCDKSKSYRSNKVNVYYENRYENCAKKVSPTQTIAEIVAEKGFCVMGGSLLFYIVPAGSRAERDYLAEKRRPIAFHSNWSSVGAKSDDDSD